MERGSASLSLADQPPLAYRLTVQTDDKPGADLQGRMDWPTIRRILGGELRPLYDTMAGPARLYIGEEADAMGPIETKPPTRPQPPKGWTRISVPMQARAGKGAAKVSGNATIWVPEGASARGFTSGLVDLTHVIRVLIHGPLDTAFTAAATLSDGRYGGDAAKRRQPGEIVTIDFTPEEVS